MAPDWDRPREGETAPAYAAFCRYRDLGAGRSIDLAYRQYAGCLERAKRAPGRWDTWATTHKWEARAREYDAHIEREARLLAEKETIKRRAAMLKRHQQAGELLTSRGVEYFAKQRVEDGRTAIAAIGKGVEVERQAEGLPTWVVEMLTADESDLRRQAADLDARRRAALAADPESVGDALSVSSSNGHAPELQPAGADPEAG